MRRFTLLLAVVLLAAAAGTGQWLVQVREDADIRMSAARVPLGGFEPLAVSFLWTRAEQMRTAGGLPQAVATYRLVAELSPHVGPAWAHMAHLLLWTDSGSGDAEAEWRWVREGLTLLERGLELNPDDPHLLWTLGLALYGRIAGIPAMREVAERELGRMPEELTVETFERILQVAPDDSARDMLRAAKVSLQQARARARTDGR